MSHQESEASLKSGNSLFVDESYADALLHYNRAIELDPSNVEALIKRSTCHYKLDNFTASLSDANSALKLEPENPKGYLRKGMALFSLDEFETALSSFQKGQQLEPENTNFKLWCRKCAAELESETKATPLTTEQKRQQPNTQQPDPPKKQEDPPKNEETTKPTPSRIRHEWYQTQTHVFVSVFVKNAKQEDTTVQIEKKSLGITIKQTSSSEFQFNVDLCDEVVPQESSFSILSTKIEVKMKKASFARWKTLEDQGEPVKQWDSVATPAAAPKPAKKNWDKIVEEETKGEKLDGEESLNKVFQDIYSGGTDEQRRAMMKSYLESGGTVLSTNWDEVGKGEVKGSPPAGMEMRKWSDLNK